MADELISRQTALEDFEKCNSENPKWTPARVKTLLVRQSAVDAVVLPCKVGDTVYTVIYDDENRFIDVGSVFAISIDGNNTMWVSVRFESGLKYYCTSDELGKTVFLTREEAEAALEGRENNE